MKSILYFKGEHIRNLHLNICITDIPKLVETVKASVN